MTRPEPDDPDGPDGPDGPDDPDASGGRGGPDRSDTDGSHDAPEPHRPWDRPDGPDGPDRPGAPATRAEPPPRGCRCCLVVLGGALFFIAPFAVVTVFILSMSGSPGDSVRDWLDAVRQGRYDAAVHQMCGRYRDSLSASELRRRVTSAGGVTGKEIEQTITRSSDAATVRARITGSGGTRQVRMSVVKEGDLWRVCSLP